MPEPDDITLLQDYAASHSEPAFAALVKRHLGLVYSTALRSVGAAHAAEEITQVVFIILARKAHRLGRRTILSGWLYQTTRLTAANYLRTEIRRQKREQEAHMQSHLNEPEADAWRQIAPLLESAMSGLSEQDRNLIVLRFFENKSSREIAERLGLNEPAAKKRVTRAVEKLRMSFSRRGVVLSATVIAGAVSVYSVHAAPVGLASSVTTAVTAKGVAAGGSTLTLLKTTLKLMAWTKAKIAIVVGVGVLLAAGTATVTITQTQKHRDQPPAEEPAYPWQMEHANSAVLDQVQPQVRIVPTQFTQFGGWGYNNRSANRKVIGICAPVKEILQAAYGELAARTVFPAALPEEKYDFIANLPSGSLEALQQEIKRKFGLTANHQTRDTDVLLLTVKAPRAPGLKPSAGQGSVEDRFIGPGHCSCPNQPLSSLAELLEGYFAIPVIDQTGVSGNFDAELRWDEQANQKNPDALKQVLLDQLGLELVPARQPMDMLVVEKTGN